MKSFALAAAATIALSAAQAADIEGLPFVIDGGTIAIHDNRIRLHGIDVPDRSQSCGETGALRSQCGQRASAALAEIVGKQRVACDVTGHDGYGRVLARCFNASGDDMGRLLVQRGYALAQRRGASPYVDDEAQARAARLGLWASGLGEPATKPQEKR